MSKHTGFSLDYIFDIKTGYFYFFDKTKENFRPLSLRFESGYFSESNIEIFSEIKDNYLSINQLNYMNIANKDYQLIQSFINLKSLNGEIIYPE
jgi:hypothetical protein|tara:strand:- start:440 stop:721 length:282 start_codon:yes stop_codon:yes gene_type:complete